MAAKYYTHFVTADEPTLATVLASVAERTTDIDVARAQAAKDAAQNALSVAQKSDDADAVLVLSAGMVETRRLGVAQRLSAAPISKRAVVFGQMASMMVTAIAMALPWNAWLGVATVPEGWFGAIVAAAAITMDGEDARPWAAAASTAFSMTQVCSASAGLRDNLRATLVVRGNCPRSVEARNWIDSGIRLNITSAETSEATPAMLKTACAFVGDGAPPARKYRVSI